MYNTLKDYEYVKPYKAKLYCKGNNRFDSIKVWQIDLMTNSIDYFYKTINQYLYDAIMNKYKYNTIYIKVYYKGKDQIDDLMDDKKIKLHINNFHEINIENLKHYFFKDNNFVQFLLNQYNTSNSKYIDEHIIDIIHMQYTNMPYSFEMYKIVHDLEEKIASDTFDSQNKITYFHKKLNLILCGSLKKYYNGLKISLVFTNMPMHFPKNITLTLLKYGNINLKLLQHNIFKENIIIKKMYDNLQIMNNITQNIKIKYLTLFMEKPKWYYTQCYMKNIINKKIKDEILNFYYEHQ